MSGHLFPPADIGTAGRLRDALAGGHNATGGDADVADGLVRLVTGLPGLVLSALAWHRRAAAWALERTQARGVIFTAAGFPPADEMLRLHGAAAEADPSARFAFACDGADATLMTRALVVQDSPGRMAAYCAPAHDPGAVLRAPEGAWAARGAPVSVHVVLAAHRWPGEVAAGVLAGYGELLPPGSTVCLTLGVPSGDAGRRLVAAVTGARAGGPVYAHTRADVEAWVTGARGLELAGRVEDVPEWVAGPRPAAGRVAAAVALVR